MAPYSLVGVLPHYDYIIAGSLEPKKNELTPTKLQLCYQIARENIELDNMHRLNKNIKILYELCSMLRSMN
jgi:hypothetical protein